MSWNSPSKLRSRNPLPAKIFGRRQGSSVHEEGLEPYALPRENLLGLGPQKSGVGPR